MILEWAICAKEGVSSDLMYLLLQTSVGVVLVFWRLRKEDWSSESI
jgi:hypothetical protein